MNTECYCFVTFGARTEAQRCFKCPMRTTTIDTSQGRVVIVASEALSRNEVRAYSFSDDLQRCGYDPEASKRALCCPGCHLYPCADDSSCPEWLAWMHNRYERSVFADADAWYAREVERMRERAPA